MISWCGWMLMGINMNCGSYMKIFVNGPSRQKQVCNKRTVRTMPTGDRQVGWSTLKLPLRHLLFTQNGQVAPNTKGKKDGSLNIYLTCLKCSSWFLSSWNLLQIICPSNAQKSRNAIMNTVNILLLETWQYLLTLPAGLAGVEVNRYIKEFLLIFFKM